MPEISEKTFELNITSELLNLSREITIALFNKYFQFPNVCNSLLELFKSDTLFSVGLTQEQEARLGYDVAINDGDKRVLFLQYKSGVEKKYSLNSESQFSANKQTCLKLRRHIAFGINNDSANRQHVVLRGLAQNEIVKEYSVLYVFPRMTTMDELINAKERGGIWKQSSFVPVLDIDKQARDNGIAPIESGIRHRYRTNYEGTNSEVNYYYYYYYYSESYIQSLIAEVVLIQMERFYNKYAKAGGVFPLIPIEKTRDGKFLKSTLKIYDESWIDIILERAYKYSEKVFEYYSRHSRIPSAPSKYTCKLKELRAIQDLHLISYQIF
ncbi:MAG: hypothetical protein HWE24_16655 [Oceanospirillaceae bacterium]|nr:hypothetical protein [Oceanospirillaceae bacterium]